MPYENMPLPPRFRAGDRRLILITGVVAAVVVIGGRFASAFAFQLEALRPDLTTCALLAVESLAIVIVLAVLQSRTLGSRVYVVVSTLLVVLSGAAVAIIDAPARDLALWIKAGSSAIAVAVAAVMLNAKRR